MIDAIFANTKYEAARHLLDATHLRHQALASNLANVETPGYKRIDLPADFQNELKRLTRTGNLSELKTPKLVEDLNATSERRDGNNVEIDKELTFMSSNTLQYNVLTEFVSSSLKQLRVAITGRSV